LRSIGIVRQSLVSPLRSSERLSVLSFQKRTFCSAKEELPDDKFALNEERPFVHALHIYMHGFLGGELKEVGSFFKELQNAQKASHDTYYWLMMTYCKFNKKAEAIQLLDEMGEIGRSPHTWLLLLKDFKPTLTQPELDKLNYFYERDLLEWAFKKVDPKLVQEVKKYLLLPADQTIHKQNWKEKMDPKELDVMLKEHDRVNNAQVNLIKKELGSEDSSFRTFLTDLLHLDSKKDLFDQINNIPLKDMYQTLDKVAEEHPELANHFRELLDKVPQ